jgi:hypothetical protein
MILASVHDEKLPAKEMNSSIKTHVIYHVRVTYEGHCSHPYEDSILTIYTSQPVANVFETPLR